MNYYFTSDLHFCHDKDFIYGPRGFKSVEEHDDIIINNINSVVQPDDVLFILGDIMLNNNDKGLKYLNRINCEKVNIIFGNHDTISRQGLYYHETDCFVLGYAHLFQYNSYHFMLSHYPTLTDNNDSDKPLKRRVINLCGHTHTKDKFVDWDKGLIYHVELDAHNNYPVHIDQIIKDIQNKLNER